MITIAILWSGKYNSNNKHKHGQVLYPFTNIVIYDIIT